MGGRGEMRSDVYGIIASLYRFLLIHYVHKTIEYSVLIDALSKLNFSLREIYLVIFKSMYNSKYISPLFLTRALIK